MIKPITPRTRVCKSLRRGSPLRLAQGRGGNHRRASSCKHLNLTRNPLPVVLGETPLAKSVIERAMNRGATPPEIYLDVLAPKQTKIGELWHQGTINVAQEHLATTITMHMMDIQRQAITPRTPLGRRAVVTPVEGDPHFVGARMIADLLMMDGWDVDFFWSSAPPKDLAEYVQQRHVDLLALSSTMPEYLPNARATANALQKLDPPRPKILLGGSALNTVDQTANELGADAVATGLVDAVTEARRLVGITVEKPSLQQQLASTGQKIRRTRSQRKMTQQQLADASGLDRT